MNQGKVAEVQAAFTAALGALDSALRQAAENGRCEIEERRHKRGGGSAGKAEISAWAKGLDLNDERWRHGKKFLSAVRFEFKRITTENLKTDALSQFLEIAELKTWIAGTKRTNKTNT